MRCIDVYNTLNWSSQVLL